MAGLRVLFAVEIDFTDVEIDFRLFVQFVRPALNDILVNFHSPFVILRFVITLSDLEESLFSICILRGFRINNRFVCKENLKH